MYAGCQHDEPQDRPLILEFLNHAQWFLHNRVKDRTVQGVMLQKTKGGGYWKKEGIYVDRIGAARHFIARYGD